MRTAIIISILTLLLLSTLPLAAQQQNQFSQYMLNPYLINPGATGMENYGDARVGYRKQWAGLDDAPVSAYASYHQAIGPAKTPSAVPQLQYGSLPVRGRMNGMMYAPMSDDEEMVEQTISNPRARHGLGGYLMHDKAGPISRTGLYATYAYHLPISRSLTASLGMGLGMAQSLISSDRVWIDRNDQLITQNASSKLLPDMNVGGFIYHKKFYLGLSGFQLFQNSLKTVEVPEASGVNKLHVHYFLTGGYRIALSPDWELMPVFLIKYSSPSPISYETGAKVMYKELLQFGLSYRREDALTGILGIRLNEMFLLNYSYDYIISALSTYTSGSHEIMLGMRLYK